VTNDLTQIGNSDIFILPSENKRTIKIRVPVPPSTNERLTIGWRRVRVDSGVGFEGQTISKPRLVNTSKTKGYYQNAYAIRIAMIKLGHKPINYYEHFFFTFFLRNRRYDHHNGLKLVCDLLEKSSVVENDNYIVPVCDIPIIAPDDPRLVIEFDKFQG